MHCLWLSAVLAPYHSCCLFSLDVQRENAWEAMVGFVHVLCLRHARA
jgi:hypothetical protein